MSNERRIVQKYSPPGIGMARPADEPKPQKALPGPPDSPPEPKPTGPRAPRYNLTVRLSADERDHLRAIGKAVGRPDPLTLAETVRWLIRQQRI
jgi:hypothetical protein